MSTSRTISRSSLFVFTVVLSGLLPVDQLRAHPAHAKPVDYPFVVGFERFYSSQDSDDYLAKGGMVLLNELNCAACHSPPEAFKDRLIGSEATRLRGVADRLDSVELELLIRNPRFLKRDTTMPSLFAGPDRDLDEVEALKHYLAQFNEPCRDYPEGNVEAGRALYHRIGCVACHAPEVGYRPEGVPQEVEIELTGLPSVPMNLADIYRLDSVTDLLLNPHHHRPSGRMPDFHLTEPEAADLAAYLKAGQDLILPDALTETLEAEHNWEIDPKLATLGRDLFTSKRCVACHLSPETDSPALSPIPEQIDLPSLASLSGKTGGCLSKRPVSNGVPHFSLDVVQVRAIALAIDQLAASTTPDLEAPVVEQLDWAMQTLNCYACHERDGKGGPEYSREVYFGVTDPSARELGVAGHLPPPLTGVGARLSDQWLEATIHGHWGPNPARPYQAGRMPIFRKDDVDQFAGWFKTLDRVRLDSSAPAKSRPPHLLPVTAPALSLESPSR
ncbi:MAG: c-type cytochrome [Verrucomicrobiota bacterium]